MKLSDEAKAWVTAVTIAVVVSSVPIVGALVWQREERAHVCRAVATIDQVLEEAARQQKLTPTESVLLTIEEADQAATAQEYHCEQSPSFADTSMTWTCGPGECDNVGVPIKPLASAP